MFMLHSASLAMKPLLASSSEEDQAMAKKIKFQADMSKPQILASAQQQSLISSLFTYKDFSNEEVTKDYIDFMTGPERGSRIYTCDSTSITRSY